VLMFLISQGFAGSSFIYEIDGMYAGILLAILANWPFLSVQKNWYFEKSNKKRD